MKVIGREGYIGSAIDPPEGEGTILLAGHSSVKMCENDPDGAWVNNVEYFRSVLNNCEKPLIYASSGSVYEGVDCKEGDPLRPKGIYDLTKMTIDSLTLNSKQKAYGLRFATVCGWSPNLRVDVMINKMFYDAMTKNRIYVVNPELPRPILGINDLNRAIHHIAENDIEPGIYNLASFNSTVGDLATAVSKRFNVPILERPPTNNPYAMSISTEKFEATGFEFEDTVESILDSLQKPLEKVGVRE